MSTPDGNTSLDYYHKLQAIRARQREKGYVAEHDDEHGIRHLLNWAIEYARVGRTDDSAAIVLAALDWVDRNLGDQGRHKAPSDRAERRESGGHCSDGLYSTVEDELKARAHDTDRPFKYHTADELVRVRKYLERYGIKSASLAREFDIRGLEGGGQL